MTMTLRTIEDYTTSQIIEYVAEFLGKQGCKGFDSARRVCAYRTPEGNKCGIGSIMSDEEYQMVLDAGCRNCSVDFIYHIFNITEPVIRTLLWDIQMIHDDYQPEQWSQNSQI